MVAAWGGHGDDQLLPLLRANAPEAGQGGAPPDLGPHAGHLGTARSLPRPGAGRAPPRRRAQPRPRRATRQRLPLGPSRRGRARQPNAHRLLRTSPPDPTRTSVDHVVARPPQAVSHPRLRRRLVGPAVTPAEFLGAKWRRWESNPRPRARVRCLLRAEPAL